MRDETSVTLWTVNLNNNLTAYDTFNEDTFEGPTNVTESTFLFASEDAALAFYQKGRASQKWLLGPALYYTYPREIEFSRMRNSVDVEIATEDGASVLIPVPSMNALCSRCNGEGTHTNPSIDSHGLTSEDLADDDFREAYLTGQYDVRCEKCHGNKVVRVPDWESMPKDLSLHARRLDNEVCE